MTESPVPEQRPMSDPADPPDAAARRQVTVPGQLEGRMLLQAGVRRVGYVLEQLDPVRSGLVISGSTAMTTLDRLRGEGFTGPALVDLAVYTASAATEDEPFPSLATGQMSFTDPLEDLVADQIAHGASAAMTPTGYIHAEDSDALRAAARRVKELGDDRVVFTVPIDVAWLRDEPVRQLIAVLNMVPGVKALMLGGQMDPLGGFPEAVRNLRKVLAEVPGTAVLRADLAAFGALAHGAVFTAYGATSSVRHIVPPPQPAKTSNRKGGPSSPHVLFPELMDFFLGETLAKKFAAYPAPVCQCQACGGRALDTFTSRGTEAAAVAHNAAILMQWLGTLEAVAPGLDRQRWWQQRCQKALDCYPVWNAALEQVRAFKEPEQLRRWAQVQPAGQLAAPAAPAHSDRTTP